MVAYGVQLLLNFLWSFIFFGARAPGWAFLEILLLWVALLWTVVLFLRVSRWGGVLLVPYLGWVTFASVLNGAIWILNR
jgi:tryptophan-rich sensory protein